MSLPITIYHPSTLCINILYIGVSITVPGWPRGGKSCETRIERYRGIKKLMARAIIVMVIVIGDTLLFALTVSTNVILLKHMSGD